MNSPKLSLTDTHWVRLGFFLEEALVAHDLHASWDVENARPRRSRPGSKRHSVRLSATTCLQSLDIMNYNMYYTS